MEEEPGTKNGHTTVARYHSNPNACETTKGLKSVGRQLTELRLETGSDLEAARLALRAFGLEHDRRLAHGAEVLRINLKPGDGPLPEAHTG